MTTRSTSRREQVIDVTATSAAPPERVWALLADINTWTRWGPWRSAGLHRTGVPAPDGIGAVRWLRRGPFTTVEEIVTYEPLHRLGYELRSGLPLRGYRAEVTLMALPDGGTTVRWQSRFTGAVPGLGALIRPGLKRFIAGVTAALATAAEETSTT